MDISNLTHSHKSRPSHPFHLVDPSPWPAVTSLAVLVLGIGGVLAMHKIDVWTFKIGLIMVLACAAMWWKDVIYESNTPNTHTPAVQTGLRLGMSLFILSEVFFFVAFFWAYFHAALMPTEATGGVWPPKGIQTLDPFHLPYFNTLLLLLSGTTLTWSHHALLNNDKKSTVLGLGLTIGLGLLFTTIQIIEYSIATFGFKDGIYPSTFYLATGFHGAHVLIGTIFLIVCWFRARKEGEFTPDHHVGFESAAWYWHFVDVVWLFLFVCIYWWGYAPTLD